MRVCICRFFAADAIGTAQVRENRDNDGLLGDDNMRRQIRREKMMLDSRRHARFTRIMEFEFSSASLYVHCRTEWKRCGKQNLQIIISKPRVLTPHILNTQKKSLSKQRIVCFSARSVLCKYI